MPDTLHRLGFFGAKIMSYVDMCQLHDQNQIRFVAHFGCELAGGMSCDDNAVFEGGFNGLEVCIFSRYRS